MFRPCLNTIQFIINFRANKKLNELHDRYPYSVVSRKNWREEMEVSDDELLKSEEEEDVVSQFGTIFSILYETWLEGRPVNPSFRGK